MDTNIGLWCVFVIFIYIDLIVSIVQQGTFVIKVDKRIATLPYGETVIDSIVDCSRVCHSSAKCTGANYRAETRTCHFLTRHVLGLKMPRAGHISVNPKSYCESIGGGLANVLTTADQEMILSILNQYGNPLVWVAGSDKEKEGEWVWSNGCRFDDQDFSFWIPGQPSNWLGNEHCLQLKYLQWNDENCAKLYTFVCEIIVA